MIRHTYRSVWIILISIMSACGSPLSIAPTRVPASTITVQHVATDTVVPAPLPATTTPELPSTAVAPATGVALGLNPAPLAAVQTIVDYYAAINQQQYAVAYRFWAQPSQTLAQFAAGFADTIESRVRIGQVDISLDHMIVPVTIVAVVNQTTGDQVVQWFRGTYTVQNAQILDATITAITAPAPRDDDDPTQLVTNYYIALQQYQFATAYTLWADNGGASQLAYADFVQHIADTQGATISTGDVQQEGAAGSTYATIPVVARVPQGTDVPRVWCGTYTVRRAMVPPFEQLGWRITQADMQAVTIPSSDDATLQRLLRTGCTP